MSGYVAVLCYVIPLIRKIIGIMLHTGLAILDEPTSSDVIGICCLICTVSNRQVEDTCTAFAADGIVRDRTVTFDDGMRTALRTSQTRLFVASEVGVRCLWHTRLTDGVCPGSTRSNGAHPRRTGRTLPADPASTHTSTVAVKANLPLVVALTMKKETGGAMAFHWCFDAFWCQRTYSYCWRWSVLYTSADSALIGCF